MTNEEIQAALLAKNTADVLDPRHLLSTGSTLLDLALTGRPQGGLRVGNYYFWVGASSGGKTMAARTVLAEAAQRRRFDNHRLIHDDVERGALMDTVKFFGNKLAARLEVRHSNTTDDFYFGVDKLGDDGQPFIYILDSMDALTTKEDTAFVAERQKKWEAGSKPEKGSYGMSKAKENSVHIRRMVDILAKTGSILIIVGQLRDNVDSSSWEEDVTTGGRALKFYATAQIFSRPGSVINIEHNGINRQVGHNTRVKVKKNRLSGKEWEVMIPIYHSYGIDDLGSCVDYLVDEKRWPKTKNGIIDALDFEVKGYRNKIIDTIAEGGIEAHRKLKTVVAGVWQDVEEAISIKRACRYE